MFVNDERIDIPVKIWMIWDDESRAEALKTKKCKTGHLSGLSGSGTRGLNNRVFVIESEGVVIYAPGCHHDEKRVAMPELYRMGPLSDSKVRRELVSRRHRADPACMDAILLQLERPVAEIEWPPCRYRS